MFSILIKWWPGNLFLASLFVTIFIFHKTTGQVIQSDRYEIPMGDNEPHFNVTPAEDHGLFLHRNLAGIKNDVLELIFLDTAFQEKWKGYLPLEKNFIVAGQYFFQNSLYVLLRYRDFTKNEFKIISIQYEKGQYIQDSFKNFIPFSPIEFHVTRKAAIVGGYFNRVPVALYLDFTTRKSKVVPGLFNEAGELTQIRTYPDDTFDVLVRGKNPNRQETIYIRNYTAEGSLIRNIMVDPGEGKNLIFGRSLKTNSNLQIVAGVYGSKNSEYSKGIFLASIDPSGAQQMRYYSYGDLKNFFKYMRAKREQRIKSRIERRRIKGRKTRFNYRFLVNELVPYQNQYVLLGEAFYPHYIYNNYNSGFYNPYYAYSRYSSVQSGRIFDGYYFTHAVVIGFDNDGKILWDNSFEINDVKTYTLEQFVKFDVKEDKIALLYSFENEIRSKIIKNDSVLEGKVSSPIKLKSENEVIKKGDTDVSKLKYWYQHYFFAYGVQKITRWDNGLAIKRRVFFINKIYDR